MVRGLVLVISLGFLAIAIGCAVTPPAGFLHEERMPVASLLEQVRKDVERDKGAQQTKTLTGLAEAARSPVLFKLPPVVQILTDPWRGFVTFEQRMFRLAVATLRPQSMVELTTALQDMRGRPASAGPRIAPPVSSKPEDHLAYLESVLVEADRQREQAIAALSDSERRFLFDHAAFLANYFIPQLSEQNEDQRLRAVLNNRFFKLTAHRIDETALLAAAQTVASLADDDWLRAVGAVFEDLPPLSQPVPWVTGTVLFMKETPAGWIVIGGRGPNTYRDGGQRVALLLDLGGNDTYMGAAAQVSALQGISVVIDLEGDDIYQTGPLGLATGRLGVGLLIDKAGDDEYRLAAGSGGVGFAGIGLLVDQTGNDRYVGSRFTQGAAIGGIGLLVDRAGDDDYSSFGYAIGVGGPLGIGAVVDLTGNDAYQCGNHYPSGYNQADAPEAKPGDARFQYDCFGIGAGVGQRLLPKQEPPVIEDVAGGIGLVLDLEGDDRVSSANFSQGVGYFYGAGFLIDAQGRDEYGGARFGQGAGAHFGVGIFVDQAGEDRYHSTGPVYTGAAAWDRSVALFVDAGPSVDQYDFEQSTGLGVADHRAWSLFIDAGGPDRYAVQRGKGAADEGSFSAFIDR